MKFSEARLCLDCDWLFAGEQQCPKCGSSEWVYPYSWSTVRPDPLVVAEVQDAAYADISVALAEKFIDELCG